MGLGHHTEGRRGREQECPAIWSLEQGSCVKIRIFVIFEENENSIKTRFSRFRASHESQPSETGDKFCR